MSRTLTASDRSRLIRLASSMPVGSPERKAILAGLGKVSPRDRVERVIQFLFGVSRLPAGWVQEDKFRLYSSRPEYISPDAAKRLMNTTEAQRDKRVKEVEALLNQDLSQYDTRKINLILRFYYNWWDLAQTMKAEQEAVAAAEAELVADPEALANIPDMAKARLTKALLANTTPAFWIMAFTKRDRALADRLIAKSADVGDVAKSIVGHYKASEIDKLRHKLTDVGRKHRTLIGDQRFKTLIAGIEEAGDQIRQARRERARRKALRESPRKLGDWLGGTNISASDGADYSSSGQEGNTTFYKLTWDYEKPRRVTKKAVQGLWNAVY